MRAGLSGHGIGGVWTDLEHRSFAGTLFYFFPRYYSQAHAGYLKKPFFDRQASPR